MTKKCLSIWKEEKGAIVVEATILFPVIIMILFGALLLAMYLPVRAHLQRATQYAASAVAVQESDLWLTYDTDTMGYYWREPWDSVPNFYERFMDSEYQAAHDQADRDYMAECIVKTFLANGYVQGNGTLEEVTCEVSSTLLTQEVRVTAEYTMRLPVSLDLVGLPAEVHMTMTSTAFVSDGDAFQRNVEFLTDFADYVEENYGGGLDTFGEKIEAFYDYMQTGGETE